MLTNKGYDVEVAVDGMDGWNAVRTGHYDLVISDIDMPRMNGFEFVEHIKGDATLRSLPVMIVSYKDREEDRARGLEVGADYYLTKGSFHDETLRIDYHHTGNAAEEFVSLDQLWRQGTWAGSRTHLIDDLDLGGYYAKMIRLSEEAEPEIYATTRMFGSPRLEM